MNTLNVHVTQEDIDAACECRDVSSRSEACPIAKAVQRTLNNRLAYVTRTRVYSSAKEPVADWALPDEATQFIDDFDTRKPVAPFSFVAVACFAANG